MSQVLQTLTDFEDSIAAQFDHYRVNNIGLYTKDLEELRHLKDFQQKTMKEARKARQAQFLSPFTSTMHLLHIPIKEIKVHMLLPPPLQAQKSMKQADELLPDAYAVIQRPPSGRRGTPRKASSEQEPGSSAQHEQAWLVPEVPELLPEPIPEAERFIPRQRRLPRPMTLPSPALSARLMDGDSPSQRTSRGKSRARPNVASEPESLETVVVGNEADRNFATEDTVVNDRGQLVTKRVRRDASDSGLGQSLNLRKSRANGKASVRQEATLADDPQPNEGEASEADDSWMSKLMRQYV